MWRNLVIVFVVTTFLTSCVSDKAWYEKSMLGAVSESTKSPFNNPLTTYSYPIDSAVYYAGIEIGNDEKCAKALAFMQSDVTLERTLPQRCHKQYYDFKVAEATLVSDTLILLFKSRDLRSRSIADKLIKVKVYEGGYEAKIFHAGSELIELESVDGNAQMTTAPQSTIKKVKLKLNQSLFAEGDEVFGEIAIDSYVKKRRGAHVIERVKGEFRLLVKDEQLTCNQEILATSFLR